MLTTSQNFLTSPKLSPIIILSIASISIPQQLEVQQLQAQIERLKREKANLLEERQKYMHYISGASSDDSMPRLRSTEDAKALQTIARTLNTDSKVQSIIDKVMGLVR